MKRIMSMLLSSIIFISIPKAYASMYTPLGQGVLDGHMQQEAMMELKTPINSAYVYDVVCSVSNPTGAKSPSKLRIDLDNVIKFDDTALLFDDQLIPNKQIEIHDNQPHYFAIKNLHPVPILKDQPATLKLIWLAGDDTTTPIHYECSATPSVSRVG